MTTSHLWLAGDATLRGWLRESAVPSLGVLSGHARREAPTRRRVR